MATAHQAMGGVDPHHVQVGLPLEVKRRMVILFAQFQRLTDVQKAIYQEFGLDLDHRTVANYNPGGPKSRVGKGLRELFHATRASWLDATANIGIAHQGHRLRRLEQLIDKAEKAREYDVAGKLLEQAAKEMGGILTNVSKREVSGTVEHRHLSPEDAKAELAMRLQAVVDKGWLLPSPDGAAEAVSVEPPSDMEP